MGGMNIQTMLLEMKRGNALITNNVKSNREFIEVTTNSNREFMEGTITAIKTQQNQIADILNVMSAGFKATQAAVAQAGGVTVSAEPAPSESTDSA